MGRGEEGREVTVYVVHPGASLVFGIDISKPKKKQKNDALKILKS